MALAKSVSGIKPQIVRKENVRKYGVKELKLWNHLVSVRSVLKNSYQDLIEQDVIERVLHASLTK